MAVLLITIIPLKVTASAESVPADPDHISTGIEYRGGPALRLGDSYFLKDFSFGGMIEVRNEERFNQEALPNHNWRGHIALHYSFFQTGKENFLTLTTGYEHESAHPTMGLNDGSNTAYEKIYDGTWRNINLNSLLFRISGSTGTGYALTLFTDFQLYFKSRNVPELTESETLTWSEGISCGTELRYPLKNNIDIFISVFDRYIFQSRKKAEGYIYHDTEIGTVSTYEKYPVINNVNTISARTGLILNDIIQNRRISIYCGILYGNIFGFVDSRDKRTQFSVGIEIFH